MSAPAVIADELGAHVSVAGGVERAPGRARDITALNLQLFTKQPNRWAEPTLDGRRVRAFRQARAAAGIRCAVAHDSYLINLASPNPDLWRRSLDSFRAELGRGRDLGLDFLVTHPGNATDGDIASGIARNAAALTEALDGCPDGPRVLLELTAGAGTTVGGRFEHLAAIRRGVSAPLDQRVGICVDTCHAFSAGYDLVGAYEDVWRAFDDALGPGSLELFHLNDSKHPFASRRDQHEMIGEGTLGEAPFRRIMRDARFQGIPKLLETPKGDDVVSNDRRNLALLRSWRT
ncbi:MAG: deoxyribonuclease IV [Gammaproteobacteria bacterium]|nr:deoxyribonuclease IV [Gammaproteobacteria bacterium]